MAEQSSDDNRPVRFAVVGMGHFAQSAILPAFATAKNAKLVALVSDDATKREELKKRYRVEHALSYGDYDGFLERGLVDGVYIALPNDLHCDYTLRAASRHIHVLCEKPMAVTSDEGQRMIDACASVKLMIAYRLHFDPANLGRGRAARAPSSGRGPLLHVGILSPETVNVQSPSK
jgi:predicted dehydrogenase